MIEYFDKSKIIVLVGTFPPPLGGVSVHIKRLYFLLKKNGYSVRIWDTSKGRLWNIFLFVKYFMNCVTDSKYVFHYHDTSFNIMKMLLILHNKRDAELFFTNHNRWFMEGIGKNYPVHFSKFIESLSRLFVVNKNTIADYKNGGFKLPERTEVISSFIMPNIEEKEEIEKTYPSELLRFIKNHNRTLLISAYRLILEKGIDLYGIDLSIELLNRLRNNNGNVGLIIALADDQFNNEYLIKLKKRINELSLESNIFFLTKQKEIWPLFEKIDLFLRPTYSDGFGVSVAEAISMNCNAIASDVCERAKGAIIFENRNLEDLEIKVKGILNKE